ncbi:hypothetical protein AQJ67_05020 [Streptomyces caeruleatus]|uniref:Uncharacterized protein n=1 Tax=Streptomyces caeruleatus TaxID=661399 RepID=A0A101U7I5_9ACTN|nr:hypothetical protein AQJ67_05020 [Streptomyces caeruleatus]
MVGSVGDVVPGSGTAGDVTGLVGTVGPGPIEMGVVLTPDGAVMSGCLKSVGFGWSKLPTGLPRGDVMIVGETWFSVRVSAEY